MQFMMPGIGWQRLIDERNLILLHPSPCPSHRCFNTVENCYELRVLYEREAAPHGHTSVTDLLQEVLVKHADNWYAKHFPYLTFASFFSAAFFVSTVLLKKQPSSSFLKITKCFQILYIITLLH